MAANLKLVGGTSTSTALPRNIEELATSRTESGAVWFSDLLGRPTGANLRARSEDWEQIAEYVAQSQRVKSLSRTMAIFASAASKWKDDTKFNSSMTSILLHPAYQRIIGLGPDVVPFVLRDLAETGAHWSWALQALTGENPVPAEHEGRPRLMAQAWFQWGRDKNLI
jgi:hypothetical protein